MTPADEVPDLSFCLGDRVRSREGVNLIKIMPSGGVRSIGDNPRHPLMTDEEIKAVIDTAHALGMKVVAPPTQAATSSSGSMAPISCPP